MSGGKGLGLRERKKAATRDALSAAALRLALEHGAEHVRVDDIAHAAGVSPRTYNNYFSSREEAIIVALAVERGLRVGKALRERPVGEPLADSVVEAVVGQYAGKGQPDRRALALISAASPLRDEFLKTVVAIEHPLAQAIAARVGVNDVDPIGPAVLAAGVSAAARVAAERWLANDPERPFAEVLRDALAWLRPAVARVAE